MFGIMCEWKSIIVVLLFTIFLCYYFFPYFFLFPYKNLFGSRYHLFFLPLFFLFLDFLHCLFFYLIFHYFHLLFSFFFCSFFSPFFLPFFSLMFPPFSLRLLLVFPEGSVISACDTRLVCIQTVPSHTCRRRRGWGNWESYKSPL